MKFFTSDLHIFHKLLAKKRGYSSVEDMNEHILLTINSIVNEDDELYIIGDFSFGKAEETIKWLEKLKCKNLYLIRGNHDTDKLLKTQVVHYFTWIKDYYILKIKDHEQINHMVLFHYPMIVWDRGHYGTWHLHGHCHGSLEINDNSTRLDVGWDVWKRPITIEDIRRTMQSKVYKEYDHHLANNTVIENE